MRMKIYNFLVNRHAGIRSRYHRVHDGGGWDRKIISYLYLLCLNFGYYCLFCRFLDKEEAAAAYEEKRLPVLPESAQQKLAVRDYVDMLSRYDVVSFDIFDTLLFRPFSEPADLFYFLGERLERFDIRRIRMEQERRARRECDKEKGHYEVTFTEIWKVMEQKTGIPAAQGMKLEEELEEEFCYANPFMKKVFAELRERGKQIICISDMYLPRAFLEKLLKKNGYEGIHKIYVSCEYGKNKAGGGLYRLVREEFPLKTAFIHCGDNIHSDVKMAKKCGFASLHYPNVNRMALSFRSYDMSPIVGGAYRGIVNNHLYQGGRSYTPEYEYGFIYGGLFVLGYCRFIHEYCGSHGVEKLLFLSRDGDILKQVYDKLYPKDNTAYVCWSRQASVKLMAEFDSYDYFRRYLYHKVNQGISVYRILEAMELLFLLEFLPDKINGENGKQIVIRSEEELNDQNVEALERFIRAHYAKVCSFYKEQQEAAKVYFEKELQGVSHAAAVDIGWAGSGAMSLSFLAERVWKQPCEIKGIIAGTNTIHSSEPDAAEPFLQSGKLVSYLYSQCHNRDLLKKHDPDKDYNIFWELLLSSQTPQFTGFYKGRIKSAEKTGIGCDIYKEKLRPNGGQCTVRHMGRLQYIEDLDITLAFGRCEENQKGIGEIRRGILDFVKEYSSHFENFPYMFRISGRDAYAPMLTAAGYDEKYLRAVRQKFAFESNVN